MKYINDTTGEVKGFHFDGAREMQQEEWDLFRNPPPTIETYKTQLASIRAELVSGGAIIDGVELQTDSNSRFEMSQYVTESVINGLVSIDWKKEDGTFETYTVQELKPVFKAIVNYVDQCFKAEKAKALELDEAEDPSTVILDDGFPINIINT